MNKSKIRELEKLLDERWEFALQTDTKLGNKTERFLEYNPDWIFYKGVFSAVGKLGLQCIRENGKHKLFK